MFQMKKNTHKHYKPNYKPLILFCSVIVAIIAIVIIANLINHNPNIHITSEDVVVKKPSESPESTTQVETASATPEATHTPEPTLTPAPISNRGTSEVIPENIRASMQGKSMKANATVSFDDLRYLTIPHYDFNYNVVTGHLVVADDVAEDVLDIFAELFDAKYPIERMELIDKYNASDYTSIEYNNTSAFNYRVVSTGTGKLSKHALGRAIDINPQQNPYVYSNGQGAHENAREFWKRDVSKWSREIDRAAYIGSDTEICRIFKKHGWTWGGDWSEKDYQHFEKTK